MSARRYRIRVYDPRGAELQADKQLASVVDLAGRGAADAAAVLDGLAVTFARADGARGFDVAGYYLAVHDWESDALECHWPARIEE